MKKKNIMLSCVAVAIATFVSNKAYELQTNKSNDLLMQNIEALSQGDVTNGFIMKINPLYTRTCYQNYCDKDKYITEQHYDEFTKEYYTINKYYHSYHKYTRKQCEVLPIEKALMWWENCNVPQKSKCNPGDTEKKPVPYEYYE